MPTRRPARPRKFPMQPPDATGARAHRRRTASSITTSAAIGSPAPSRVPAARRRAGCRPTRTATHVWVANWWGGNLAKIDLKTKKRQLPQGADGVHPYNTVVDKNHAVWTNLMSDDAVGKFDPKSGQWTIYKLPSVGAELRHIRSTTCAARCGCRIAKPTARRACSSERRRRCRLSRMPAPVLRRPAGRFTALLGAWPALLRHAPSARAASSSPRVG